MPNDEEHELTWLRYTDKQPKLPKVSKADERFMNSRAARREVKAQAKEDRKRGRN